MFSPGFIETGIFEKYGFSADELAALKTKFINCPLQRIGQPIEVAQAAAFLASENAGFITGTDFVVDGAITYTM